MQSIKTFIVKVMQKKTISSLIEISSIAKKYVLKKILSKSF